MEYDGYLVFTDARGARYQLPWHVLPRKSAQVQVGGDHLQIGSDGTGTLRIENDGVGAAQYAAYSLLGTGPRLPTGARGALAPDPSIRAVGVTTYDATGVCTAGFAFDFAVDNWKRYALPIAVSDIIWVDVDGQGVDVFGDGTKFNFAVLNRDVSFTSVTDGRQVAWVSDLASGNTDADFFVGHPTNAANLDLLVCGERLGLDASAEFSKTLRIRVEAQDFYFGGPGAVLGDFHIVPFGERYVAFGPDTPGQSRGSLSVLDFGDGLNPADQGLLIFTNAGRDTNNGGATQRSEAVVVPARGVKLNFQNDN
jgi:hypothetical protein